MFWISDPKDCSNITVRTSRLLLQDTFLLLYQLVCFESLNREAKVCFVFFSFKLQHYHYFIFYFSLSSMYLSTLLHSLSASPAAMLTLPFINCWLRDISPISIFWPTLQNANDFCLISGLSLIPLDTGVKQKKLHVACGVTPASSLPKQHCQEANRLHLHFAVVLTGLPHRFVLHWRQLEVKKKKKLVSGASFLRHLPLMWYSSQTRQWFPNRHSDSCISSSQWL